MADDTNKVICDNCESTIDDDSDFCPFCGGLFLEDVKCEVHPDKDAIGVCVICQSPICGSCAGRTDDYFLCKEHANYEIYQGMARIYGTSDFALSEFVNDSLIKAGFHPFNYSRKTSPISLGGLDYSLYRASGEFDGHIINEIKIMVPLSEVIDAEKIIDELELP